MIGGKPDDDNKKRSGDQELDQVLSVFKRIHSECTLIQLWRKGTIILSEPSINRMDDYVRQMEKSFEKILIDTKTKYIYLNYHIHK